MKLKEFKNMIDVYNSSLQVEVFVVDNNIDNLLYENIKKFIKDDLYNDFILTDLTPVLITNKYLVVYVKNSVK